VKTQSSPDVSRKYTIADMITGYGVAEGCVIITNPIQKEREAVQGF
jgi:hypothetical protein